MGNRYKRMVTLGMISFTALLAWGYCMLAYRSQAVYVAIISLVLVGSIYALLLSFVDIKVAKEQAMQEYVTKTLQEYTKKEDTEILNDMERLAKASYVQQRKTNTYLSAQAEQLDEALKKTIKILINYDRKKEEEAAQQAEQMQKELEMQAALQAQKELADCMQVWGVSLLDAPVPEQMKYDSLAEAASHLMQVLNDPEHITG